MNVMTERDLTRLVIDTAETFGWLVAHFRPARTRDGWRTPVEGNGGAGFPDLVLVRAQAGRPARVLFVELKSEGGRLTSQQRVWRDALSAVADGCRTCGCVAAPEHVVWRPADWPLIIDTLR